MQRAAIVEHDQIAIVEAETDLELRRLQQPVEMAPCVIKRL